MDKKETKIIEFNSSNFELPNHKCTYFLNEKKNKKSYLIKENKVIKTDLKNKVNNNKSIKFSNFKNNGKQNDIYIYQKY